MVICTSKHDALQHRQAVNNTAVTRGRREHLHRAGLTATRHYALEQNSVSLASKHLAGRSVITNEEGRKRASEGEGPRPCSC